MKSVTIIGYGYVGRRMAEFFQDKFEVNVYDPNIGLIKDQHQNVRLLASGDVAKAGFPKSDLFVICVPTPQAKDGSCDTSAIDETLAKLNRPEYDDLILIKSTVPPSFTQKYIDRGYKVAFSPEYLGESAYVTHHWKGYPDPTNLKTHEFQIFGGDISVTTKIIPFFRSIMGPETRYWQTDATTAELAKYMENCFFATKVTFCNEFYEIAKRFGVDYNELRELWLQDGRINRNHTVVFEEKRGYGGKCYPKDMAAIIMAAREVGYDPKLLKEVVESNRFFNTRSQ